ncbi:hypothetical protein VTK56DRAFT_3077 [Thermocarpiscus australiensis]
MAPTRKTARQPTGREPPKEIRRYQKSSELILDKLSFARLVRDIAREINPSAELRVEAAAIGALQEATEIYMVEHFKRVWEACVDDKRDGVRKSDMVGIRSLLTKHEPWLYNVGK